MIQEKISFILPTYNNLKYLKLAYNSIRNNTNKNHEIVILDDNSSDGTLKWLRKKKNNDRNLTIVKSETVRGRLGHTILYNKGVNICKNEIFSIFHADMICGPNYVKNILKHLSKGRVVSATRIEPPLHPIGKEKIIKDFGKWPNTLKLDDFYTFCKSKQEKFKGKVTNGIFAPWVMYKSDFQKIGGHDFLFAPYPLEDSDIFQRFILNEYEIIQSWDSFVYHLTCRGHKWNKGNLKEVDDKYKYYSTKARRNFIRKWGSFVKNNEYLRPIIWHKYDIGFIINNCNYNALNFLEPYCNSLYINAINKSYVDKYIKEEQLNTTYNLNLKIKPMQQIKSNDIIVEFDATLLTNNNVKFLQNLPRILADSGEIGEMEYDIFKLKIKSLKHYEKDLIVCQN